MAPDIDMVDEELVRRGVPPQVIKALGLGATSQPGTNADLIAKAGGMSSSQPQPVSLLTGGGTPRNLPAPIERLKENPQSTFVGAPAVSFSRRGSPTDPQDATAPISFTNRQQGSPADPRTQKAGSVPLSDSASQGVRAANQGDSGTGGAPPISFLNGENPDQGVSPTNVPERANAGRMLRAANQPNAEAGGTRPTSAIQSSINAGQVTEGTAAAAAAQPISLAGPAERRFEEMEKKGAPQLHGWKKWLDIAGQALSPRTEAMIPGTPGNFNVRLMQAGANATKEQAIGKERQNMDTTAAQAQFNTPEKRRAFVKANPDLLEGADQFQINDWVATGNKFPQREPAPEKATDKKIDEYTNDQGRRVLTFQRANGETYDRVGGQTQPKSSGHTSAFEAFAYGSPEEKKAAQDYIEFEKRMGTKYKSPTEFDERYRLFKEDPDTYRAMFGDKSGGGPNPANATRMLNYFDKRRREVNGDFTLDDNQKQEQLKEIENLEKPFMDAAQPGGRGGNEDRVTVVHPNGKVGTIPRSQLDKAKKKGLPSPAVTSAKVYA